MVAIVTKLKAKSGEEGKIEKASKRKNEERNVIPWNFVSAGSSVWRKENENWRQKGKEEQIKVVDLIDGEAEIGENEKDLNNTEADSKDTRKQYYPFPPSPELSMS